MAAVPVHITGELARSWQRGARLALLMLGAGVLQACAMADLRVTPDVHRFEVPAAETRTHNAAAPSSLRVMTLNVAHGRGESFHQLLQKTAVTVKNLDMISALLRREQPDVVALQEIDGASYWNGNFRHIDYLARQAEFSRAVDGFNVNGMGLAYGTALLSVLDLSQPSVVTFDPERSLTPKGFVVATVDWPGSPDVKVDVVSLHLDFSSADLRRQQAQELIEVLRERRQPLVIMGDFNAEWEAGHSVVWYIADRLGLAAYRPATTGQQTFAYSDKRLDWILISDDLDFRDYRVMADTVSDHRGVVAELVLNNQLVSNSH